MELHEFEILKQMQSSILFQKKKIGCCKQIVEFGRVVCILKFE